jgi:hypothetical protein
MTIASYREADLREGLARTHHSLRSHPPLDVLEDSFGLLDFRLVSELKEPDFPPILRSRDVRGLPSAATVGLDAPSVGPGYSPLILPTSYPSGLTLSVNEPPVEMLEISAQISPVSTDNFLDLEEDLLTFHSEQFIWRRHAGLVKEKFHILWAGEAGQRNWSLDELLVFLNELLPDWRSKNGSRHYANVGATARHQFTFRHPTQDRNIVRVSIPSNMSRIEVCSVRNPSLSSEARLNCASISQKRSKQTFESH